MKALIRGKEVYPESEWTEYTKNNLSWYIGTEKDREGKPLKGDGWTLVENYVPPEEDGDGHIPVDIPIEIVKSEIPKEEPVVTEREYVEINGIRYYRD